MDRKQILALMKAAIETPVSSNYSFNGEQLSHFALNETLRRELKALSDENFGNHQAAFRLIEEAVTDILPKRIENAYGRFAEIKTVPQSTTAIFTRKLGRIRAKQFVTRVGLAGLYEVGRLGETQFMVKTSAIGGAWQITYEEFLDGRGDFGEIAQIIMDGMDELIYREIAAALQASINQLPAANIGVKNGFDEDLMEQLITIAGAYGSPTIYCTREFASKMIPATGWVSESMKDQKWANGYLPNFHGIPVVIFDQSFQDELNTHKIIDPGYAWVIPSGGDDKPVKVVFEGSLHMKEVENYDWSSDVHVYQKVGVGVIMTNNLCVYVDTQLKGKLTW